MKRVLLVALLATLTLGCGARTEVVKDKVLKQIDELLGKMDVERKQIQIELKALTDGIEGIRKAKIKAQVKTDQLKGEVEPFQEQIAKIDEVLKKLRPHMEATKPVEIAGKSYAPNEIKETADKLLAERKRLSDKVTNLTTVEVSLEQTASGLEKQQNAYQQKLQKLQGQVAQIDAQSLALKAKQEAAAAMGNADQSLSASVDGLQEKVNNLLADGKADLQTEDEKWNEAAATKEIDSTDSTIAKFQGSGDTAAEIDKILGDSKKK